MLLKEKNKHPRDEQIKFNEKEHKYYVEGDEYMSVTTFIHSHFPKFDPEKIIEKNLKKWGKENHPKYAGKSKEEIKAMWSNNGAEKSQLGTDLHKDIEDFYNGMEITNESQEYKFFLNFHSLTQEKGLSPYRTEMIVYDEQYKLAGTIDMLYYNEKTGKYIIADWKRCKKFEYSNIFEKGYYPLVHCDNCNWIHYSLQLTTYKHILEKYYGIEVESMFLVWLYPSNDNYKIVHLKDVKEEVKTMLDNREFLITK